MKSSWIRRLTPVLLIVLTDACVGGSSVRKLTTDPTVVIHGPEADELGIATNYGIVFLGRRVNRGRIEFTSWFGDGPSLEEGVIEAVGGHLFTTSSEIQLSSVPILFRPPDPTEQVVVRGRGSGGPWEFGAEITSDPRVEGLLLKPSPDLDRLTAAQLGAGVFVLDKEGRKQLLGLITGRVRIKGSDGLELSYVTVTGPEDLWRLVLHHRNSQRPRHAIYREDIL
ncbi:MAG: hypothetical protein CMJ89_17230 [Planctomycetes bacterium]|jgi:hypothetical protein|nr:hypothetical protein [Planctomycetota bacterium]